MEAPRRATLANEEARRMKVVELVVGASISRYVAIAGGTGDSAVADEDTTEGVKIIKVVASEEPDLPAC